MPLDGVETLAKWREAGEWWAGEQPREIHRYIDHQGNRREQFRTIVPANSLHESEVLIRRTRDEKVRAAFGDVSPPCFGRPVTPSRKSVALHMFSGYAFCRGTMIAAEAPAFAAEKGYSAALLADPFSLTGAIEFTKTAERVGIKPLIGATFEMVDGGELVLVAKNPTGYRSLSRLITECHLNEPRLYPICNWDRLGMHSDGLMCLTGGNNGPIDRHLMSRNIHFAQRCLKRLISIYGRQDVYIEIERTYQPWSVTVERQLIQLSQLEGVIAVAGGPILHERPEHFPAQDVLVCIDSLCLIDEVDGRKPLRDETQPSSKIPPRRGINGERYLRDLGELSDLYCDYPDLISNANLIAEKCDANIIPTRTSMPKFCDDEVGLLQSIVELGAKARFRTVTKPIRKRYQLEIERISRLGYARHFLVAWDMCNWANGHDILLSGRGSVVDSVVAYCLGLTRIDAFEYKLHFDRFLPDDGSKRPDIDIDFEAARREDVRQYLVKKYGDAHVATVAAIGTFGSRGIVREVGKVMGIPESSLGYLAKRLHGGVSPDRLEAALDSRPELRDSNIPRERFHWVFKMAERLMDLPRNMRAHSSGVIISDIPIADTVPVVQSAVDGVKLIQWDKRSAKYCFDKFDILCLRGNDVLGGTARKVGNHFDVTGLPLNDPDVYRAMRAGELIGVPQSASPAMRQAHIRIGTQNLKDAGIVQAGIRPGVGGAVKLNEYIARRKGKPFSLTHVDMERILGPTLGIVVFQEQIDQLLQSFGNYSGDEAEEIREGIHRNRKNYVAGVEEEVVGRILENGYSRDVANSVYELVSGFKGYGFAEGHALSFAEISIRSVWCQQNYPAPYFAALLDAQPAGYYGPITIANEARTRGVQILPPCVNQSELTFKVEDVKSLEDPILVFPSGGIRTSLRQVSGISEILKQKTLERRPYSSFFDYVARVNPPRDELELLVLCGCFDSIHENRRALLWSIPAAMENRIGMTDTQESLPLKFSEPDYPIDIPDFTPTDKAIYERRILEMDIHHHLMALERTRVSLKGGLTASEASRLRPGTKAFVVGNPIRLRFPPTQSGKRVLFFDLEDETGLLNVTCFDDVYQRDGHKVICHPYVTIWGETEDRDGHLSFIAHRIHAYRSELERMNISDNSLPIVTADFLMS